jgi:GNAT superfamily N-acetyltransferase
MSSSSSPHVRAFRRPDRDQITSLVNAHVGAVVPNVSVSVSGLLSQLEREPGEYVVDPWVTDRLTVVAELRERVVAAAHLLRYAADERVSPDYRDAGEIRWLVCLPDAPHWRDAEAAGATLLAACLAQLERWSVRVRYADGALPAPGVYGVPEQWPHLRALYERAGFVPQRAETVHVARVPGLRRVPAPLPGLTTRRSLGASGTRIAAHRGDERVGYIEVESLDEAPRTQGTRTWADIGNLWVAEGERRRGVATWLLGEAADWLDLGGVTRLLGYTVPEDDAEAAFLAASGFSVLTRTLRGYRHELP